MTTSYLFTFFEIGDTLEPSAHSKDGYSPLTFAGSYIVTGDIGTSSVKGQLMFTSTEDVTGIALVGTDSDFVTCGIVDFSSAPLVFSDVDNGQPITPPITPPESYIYNGYGVASYANDNNASLLQLGSDQVWQPNTELNFDYGGTNDPNYFPELVYQATKELQPSEQRNTITPLGVYIL